MKQKVVFFLRAYNDIDHITPVIYKWLQMTDVPVAVVLRTDLKLMQDYRIEFLRQFANITIHHISEFVPGWSISRPKPTSSAPPRYHPRQIIHVFKRRLHLDRVAEVINSPNTRFPDHSPDHVRSMMNDLFSCVDQGIVVFDWIKSTGKHDFAFAQIVLDEASSRGYTDVSLPHGDSPYYNQMFNRRDLDETYINHFRDDPFHYVVVPNKLCERRYTPHKNPTQIKMLGSPRYNREWLDILTALIPQAYHQPKSSNKLKIVFFLRNYLFPIFWGEVVRTIELITQFDDVFLVLKHHTRNKEMETLLTRYPLLGAEHGISNMDVVADEIHSGALLQWADVALDVGTSIVFEAVQMSKPVLEIEYLHPNISTVAHYFQRSAIQSRDDLFATINAFRQDKTLAFYDPEVRERFLQEMIGIPEEKILTRYVEFLQEVLLGTEYEDKGEG